MAISELAMKTKKSQDLKMHSRGLRRAKGWRSPASLYIRRAAFAEKRAEILVWPLRRCWHWALKAGSLVLQEA